MLDSGNGITHCGFVALIGRPNVGKSTLLNKILGEKIVITSRKPQTTRNSIKGIINHKNSQIVIFDTPGVHEGTKLINRYMARRALSTLSEVDLVLFLVDAKDGVREEDRVLAGKISEAKVPVFVVVNKSDVREGAGAEFSPLLGTSEVFEVSALSGKGVEALLDAVAAAMPENPACYPEDYLTDRPERFIAQEFIREKVFELTGEELPYSVAVTVELWEEKPEQDLNVIHATIHVERDSQKAIIIGKGGTLIKEIGKRARMDLEKLLGTRVFLDLHVGVEKNWTKDPVQLKRFGYGEADA
jgi:GTP-binding protein Era